jgi:VanZ family protein
MITFLSWGPALLGAASIFFFSHQSQPPLATLSADYVLHFLAYLTFGLMLIWGITAGFREEFTIRRVVIVLVLALLYSASDEFHQAFIPGRDASFRDFLADVVGASAGVWTLYFFGIRQKGQLSS